MLRQKIQEDQMSALKSGEKNKLNILRYIFAKIKNKEIEKKAELDDNEVIAIVRKQAKELQESIDAAKSANRPEMIHESEEQLKIISVYLPPEMTDEDLKKEIEKIISENQDLYQKNSKAVIGIAIGKLKDKVEPGRIVKILQELNK